MSTPSTIPQDAPARHTLGPVAAKTVETIRRYPDIQRRHYHAVIAAEGEARAALQALDAGWIKPDGLAARLRDILAICEAAGGKPATPPAPDGVDLAAIGTRHPQGGAS